MIEIRHSNVDEMLANADKLFEEHWEEIALNKHLMVLKPNEEHYRALEAAGSLLVLAAFDADEIVGYSVNLIYNNLHYANLRMCTNDLIFVTKERRSGMLGYRLIKATEEEAKKMGAQMMIWHAKPETALAGLMPRVGYGIQDILFSKEI